jgi:large conductance mechanosensitive channel
MSVLQEFRDFAMRGNVVDLAVGVVIGAAFGKITTSLVNDVIMPPLGLVLGGVDFSDKAVVLKQAAGAAPAVTLKYGIFINTVIDFLIVAAAIFAVVKVMNSLRRQQEAAPAPPSAEVQLLTEIRDSLRKR